MRDPAKLPDAVRARVDVVTGSHGDAEVVDRAFAGADAVFWLVPPDPRAPSLDAAYSGFTRRRREGVHGPRGRARRRRLGARPGHPRRRSRRTGHGVAGHGRPDREHGRGLPGAREPDVHGQPAAAGGFDPRRRRVHRHRRRRPQSADGRHPGHRRGRRRPAARPLVDGDGRGPGARPRGPFGERHGAHHVRRARPPGPLRAAVARRLPRRNSPDTASGTRSSTASST